jgi:hypothetical protein
MYRNRGFKIDIGNNMGESWLNAGYPGRCTIPAFTYY